MRIGHFVVGLTIDSIFKEKITAFSQCLLSYKHVRKEIVYHGRQDDVQSVHSLYEVTEHDRKLKPGWKVLAGGL